MKTLVTGGAGFIGSNFVRMFVEGRFPAISSVTVVDKLTYAGNLNNFSGLPDISFKFVKGDIADVKLIDELTPHFDAIINFAAESHVDRSIEDSRTFVDTNITGTHTLLDSLRKHKDIIFIQISTDEVYGSITSGSWKEDHALLPNSPYAASKASADLLVRAYHQTYGLDTRITRCSNNFGPRQYPEKIIPLFITNLLEGKSLPVYGMGNNSREWLYVEDHCYAIYKVLVGGKSGEIYNIGSGKEMSNLQLAKKILNEMDQSLDKIIFVKDRLGHDLRYSVDSSKILSELDFHPSIDWNTGIKRTIDWYVKNEQWWKVLKL